MKDLKKFEQQYFEAIQALLKIADSLPNAETFRLACEEAHEIKKTEEGMTK